MSARSCWRCRLEPPRLLLFVTDDGDEHLTGALGPLRDAHLDGRVAHTLVEVLQEHRGFIDRFGDVLSLREPHQQALLLVGLEVIFGVLVAQQIERSLDGGAVTRELCQQPQRQVVMFSKLLVRIDRISRKSNHLGAGRDVILPAISD